MRAGEKTVVRRSMRERQELGRRLLEARRRWPRSGPRARGWSEYLERLGIDDSTAYRYISIAARSLLPAQAPERIRAQVIAGVYFIQGVDGGPIKIGVSIDVIARLRDLQTGSPVRLRLIGVRNGDQATEADLHIRLSQHRLYGEWFADVPDVRAVITEI